MSGMVNGLMMAPRRLVFGIMVLLLPLNVSFSSGRWQEPSASSNSVVLALPTDTLPPTADLLRSQPPLGFASLPAEYPTRSMSELQVNLGRRLFFDPILSSDQTVSCATCHQPDHGMASPDAVAIGIKGKTGRRNAPSLFNRGYGKSQFWDGRAASLEQQALQPISNPDEMGDDLERILRRLQENAEYRAEFAAAFAPAEGALEPSSTATATSVSAERLATALAAFQRCLVIADSPVDRFRAADVKELSMEARQGLWIFESRGRCWQCHSGDNFSDEQFHNTGVSFGSSARDLGRADITHDPQDRYRFKTPSLRGVAQTAPYMHDGSAKSLEDVVEFYNRGGSPEDPELSPLLQPLNLSVEERRYLVEFLRALSPSQSAASTP
jgi:cytochrome c peroxidase